MVLAPGDPDFGILYAALDQPGPQRLGEISSEGHGITEFTPVSRLPRSPATPKEIAAPCGAAIDTFGNGPPWLKPEADINSTGADWHSPS